MFLFMYEFHMYELGLSIDFHYTTFVAKVFSFPLNWISIREWTDGWTNSNYTKYSF